MSYLEPVYLNEKMLLNSAAYAFKGVAMETEVMEDVSTKAKGNLSLGFKFLQELISPIAASAEVDRSSERSSKTARRYTLGGLHMTLLDSLLQDGVIEQIAEDTLGGVRENFVQLDVLLKPIDLFSIIETLKISTPLVSQFLQNFGEKINSKLSSKNIQKDIPKYESLFSEFLDKLESDYLTSGQIEMIMISPVSRRQIGIVDIDVTDLNPSAVRAKLTDGKFKVIGKISRQVDEQENMSLVQRTVLSSLVDILDKISGLGSAEPRFLAEVQGLRPAVESICQLSLRGPAVRVVAMSICI